ncbi:S1/P1 nuclease [Fibrella sp. HMF5335]|uniref:S1/P1 nuclease n=1 Tax=Fibrella rubiginis TaxID=2817060 RepID=A0A939GGZ1_9BACT|nr:S1/P1 nuclease [Fibrella rubiginis]MBO0937034.1 S1/P1 nuclease [Fibrella rubiginis]
MNRSFSLKSGCALLLLLCLTGSSFGWNKPTHMAIGAIAYRDMLAKSPKQLVRVLAILRQHPDMTTRWAPMLRDSSLTENEKNEYLFMLAARWPDDIRGQKNPNDHPSWHYINYVYNPTQGVARTDTTLATGENILQAFALNRQILTSNAPDSTKAIALCWLFHLAGDVHMPLHTAALVSPQFPDGDRGGNLFKIKVSMSNPTLNLHAFWDGMLLGTDTYRAADQLAIQLGQAHTRRQVPHRRSTDIGEWSRESFDLARNLAYKQGTLTAGTGDNGVVLPSDYVSTVKPIAEQQVAFSGHRLATVLRQEVRE